jgi:hypothetical protein
MSRRFANAVSGNFGTPEVHDVFSIGDRLKLINIQVFKSLQDPSMRSLALDLVRGTLQHGPESELAEVSRIFWFVKNNIEYRQDPHNYDLYSTASRTLQTRSGDCFTLDTPVIVKAKASGCYEIKTLASLETSWPAYEALTYDFSAASWTFKNILGWNYKGVKEVFESHLSNGPRFRHTGDHKVWWLDGQNKSKRVVEDCLARRLEDNRVDRKRVLIASKIPALGNVDVNESQAYLSGIFAAEGFSDGSHVRIAQDKPEIRERIEKHLAFVGADCSSSSRQRNAYYNIRKCSLKQQLKEQGTSSFNMTFGKDILGASENTIRVAYNAYCDGDGYKPKEDSALFNRVHCIAATSSNQLASELCLMLMIMGEPWHDYLQENHMGVGTKPIHRISQWSKDTRGGKRGIEELPGVAYANFKSMEPCGEDAVCDLTIADTHNFVLGNGMITHNCDDHAILTDALLGNLGFIPGAKVISPDGANWHIYAVTSLFPRHNPQAPTARYIALDTTQPPSTPGWEPPAKFRRFEKTVTFTENGPLVHTVR